MQKIGLDKEAWREAFGEWRCGIAFGDDDRKGIGILPEDHGRNVVPAFLFKKSSPKETL